MLPSVPKIEGFPAPLVPLALKLHTKHNFINVKDSSIGSLAFTILRKVKFFLSNHTGLVTYLQGKWNRMMTRVSQIIVVNVQTGKSMLTTSFSG